MALFEQFETGIDTLDAVLVDGIACLPWKGMLGAIVGAAGAGKSILALHMCCSFLLNRRQKNPAKTYGSVYITYEDPALIEAKVKDFNYFRWKSARDDKLPITKDSLEPLLKSPGGQPALCVCRVPLEEERQSKVLENIFDTIAQRIEELGPRKDASGNVLVCVDNIRTIRDEALLSAVRGRAGDSGEDRQPGGPPTNFYKELHRYCAERQLHTFLVMEEDVPEGIDPERYEVSYRPEVFAADIVIRLGIRTYSTEYRERFLQIVKAKHQFYYRGKHHFSIVSKRGGGRPSEKRRGIVIYPSIPMQLSLLQKKRGEKGSRPRLTLGVPLLDRRIRDAIPLGTRNEGYIRPCTNSVLVCDLDAMATIIALHFALQGGPRGTFQPHQGIFISFKHKPEDIRKIADRFFLSKGAIRDLDVYYFPPEYISGHKLLRDISELVTRTPQEPLRLVIDNVFELQCKYPLITDARSFLASLFEVFSRRRVTSLVVDTVEVGEGRNPIESSFAAGLADNVFLLRHVEFHSRPHRVFSVLKLVDVHTPDNLWDLEEVRQANGLVKLSAGDKFALYRNVLTGQPEPITITFSFYKDEENSPFHTYLQGQIESLRHSFGESLNVNLYGAHEYSRVQNLLAAAEKLPRGDCHIVALDEFWLRTLIEKERLEELSEPLARVAKESATSSAGPEESRERSRRAARENPVAAKREYVSAAHDIALHQLRGSSGHARARSDSKYYRRWYAVPARNNCGILCFDKDMVGEVFQKSPRLRRLKRWMNDPGSGGITWDDLVELRREFRQSNGERSVPSLSFFTFCMDQLESCVSFLLELALSSVLDRRSHFLVPDRKAFLLKVKFSRFPCTALRTLVDLLDDRELEKLASGMFRLPAEEPAALFSRQWMSTLGCLRGRQRSVMRSVYGSRRHLREPDCDGYFQKLEAHELPTGRCGHPTPVSGTWYLGILKGSIAIETGVKLIQQFTSVGDELYKLNNCIGFPVRKGFYESKNSYRLPYNQRFCELARIQGEFITDPKSHRQDYTTTILQEMYPLYRMLIQNYEYVALILWRLMIKAARKALDVRRSGSEARLNRELHLILKAAGNEYKAALTQKRR